MLSNLTLLFFTFLYWLLFSSPLLCVFQSLVYSRSTGERDMFAHSLTRRGWQKAGNHNEQICSCKVNPTEGNCGLFVAVCGVRWGFRGSAVTTWAPHLQLLYFFHVCVLEVVTDAFSRCSNCSFFVKQAMLMLTHRVSVQLRGRDCPVSCRTWVHRGMSRSLERKKSQKLSRYYCVSS